MILAAGRGERLAPLTDSVPKPSSGRRSTLIERHVARLVAAGCADIVVNVAHLRWPSKRVSATGCAYGRAASANSRETGRRARDGGGIARALAPAGPPHPSWSSTPHLDRLRVRQPLRSTGARPPDPGPNPPHLPHGDFELEAGRVRRRAQHRWT